MRRLIVLSIVMVLAVPVWAQHPHFSLHLNMLVPAHLDPATEARRAQWNSPLGRVQYQLAELQASIGAGGMPHRATQGLIGLKAQRGARTRVITSALQSGVPVYSSPIAVIHWPWEKGKAPHSRVLPLDRQLSILLGRRLARQPAGSQ